MKVYQNSLMIRIQSLIRSNFILINYRIQAIGSILPGMSQADQMSLSNFAKKMENMIFSNANTKVTTFYFSTNHKLEFNYL